VTEPAPSPTPAPAPNRAPNPASTAAGSVRLRGVAVEHGGRTVLHPIDLDIEAGAWLGIVGPNGAGKTTLLRALAGTVPHDGALALGGEATDGLRPRERARLLAVAPQQPTIPAGVTVSDYVLLGRTPHIPLLGSETAHDLAVVGEVLALLDLTGLAPRELATLSGGERQRAVIARALAQEAPVLVLDEPTTALDIGHQQQVLALVDDLRHERRLTVVSAMHDLTLAAQHADRFVLLHEGRVAARGSAREVFTPDTVRRVFDATVTVLDDDGDLVIVPRRGR
jgi:iron complex transport system ATP-binding protein